MADKKVTEEVAEYGDNEHGLQTRSELGQGVALPVKDEN